MVTCLNKLINSLPSRLLMPRAQCAQIMEQWHMNDPVMPKRDTNQLIENLIARIKQLEHERRQLMDESAKQARQIEEMDESIEALLMERALEARTT